jgi:hypothetical protein
MIKVHQSMAEPKDYWERKVGKAFSRATKVKDRP